jgi:hypothetical protein
MTAHSERIRTHHPPTTLAARKKVIKDGIGAEVLDASSTNSHTTARPNPLLHSFLASRGDFSRLTSRTSSFQRLLKRKKLLVGRVILSRSNYAASRPRRSSSTKTAQPDCYSSQASTVRLPAVPSLPNQHPAAVDRHRQPDHQGERRLARLGAIPIIQWSSISSSPRFLKMNRLEITSRCSETRWEIRELTADGCVRFA